MNSHDGSTAAVAATTPIGVNWRNADICVAGIGVDEGAADLGLGQWIPGCLVRDVAVSRASPEGERRETGEAVFLLAQYRRRVRANTGQTACCLTCGASTAGVSSGCCSSSGAIVAGLIGDAFAPA